MERGGSFYYPKRTYANIFPNPYYFFNAYFLIFLITVSALTIFSVDCKMPQSRLQTTFTLLLTSVSFKWVINRSLPHVSYLTSLDKYAIVCFPAKPIRSPRKATSSQYEPTEQLG